MRYFLNTMCIFTLNKYYNKNFSNSHILKTVFRAPLNLQNNINLLREKLSVTSGKRPTYVF